MTQKKKQKKAPKRAPRSPKTETKSVSVAFEIPDMKWKEDWGYGRATDMERIKQLEHELEIWKRSSRRYAATVRVLAQQLGSVAVEKTKLEISTGKIAPSVIDPL